MIECLLCGDITADYRLVWKHDPLTGKELEDVGLCAYPCAFYYVLGYNERWADE